MRLKNRSRQTTTTIITKTKIIFCTHETLLHSIQTLYRKDRIVNQKDVKKVDSATTSCLSLSWNWFGFWFRAKLPWQHSHKESERAILSANNTSLPPPIPLLMVNLEPSLSPAHCKVNRLLRQQCSFVVCLPGPSKTPLHIFSLMIFYVHHLWPSGRSSSSHHSSLSLFLSLSNPGQVNKSVGCQLLAKDTQTYRQRSAHKFATKVYWENGTSGVASRK